MKKTKIIATIGPSSQSENSLIELYKNGVNIIRFNFSHADYFGCIKSVELIKKLNKEGKTNFSLLLDTKGPEIRTGILSKPINIIEGELYKIYVDKNLFIEDGRSIFCDYFNLINDSEIGQKIIIDSGLLQTTVVNIDPNYIEIKAENSLLLTSKRHINLPGICLKLPGITSQDEKDIEFALENEFDFIAASFIRNKDGIDQIKQIFKKYNNPFIKIISKIENDEAIQNLDEIISASDGVMVARGDLGIEVPIEKLGLYQREIVEKSKDLGKFVIIATHLLETMIQNPFPTRAETSDIFNSVLQRPDCLMLSGETAIGNFPIQSVNIMTKIIKEAEKYLEYDHIEYTNNKLTQRNIEKKLLISAGIQLGQELEAQALVILTKSGLLARLASLYRPKIPVYGFTNFEKSAQIMNIYYGIKPIYLKNWNNEDYLFTMDIAIEYLLNNDYISSNAKIIAINDIQKGGIEIPIIEIIHIKDFLYARK